MIPLLASILNIVYIWISVRFDIPPSWSPLTIFTLPSRSTFTLCCWYDRMSYRPHQRIGSSDLQGLSGTSSPRPRALHLHLLIVMMNINARWEAGHRPRCADVAYWEIHTGCLPVWCLQSEGISWRSAQTNVRKHTEKSNELLNVSKSVSHSSRAQCNIFKSALVHQ